MTSPRLPLFLVLAGFLLAPCAALAQEADRARVSVSTGYSVPIAGYHWGGSAPWSSKAHLHTTYERAVSPAVRLGGVASYDSQASGGLSVSMFTAAVRGAYGRWESGGFALAPFAEAGASVVAYRSGYETIAGSTQLAPRVGFGATVRQQVWREAALVGEVGYQFVLDRFDGFTYTVPPLPRGLETVPPPSFRYTVARVGVSWSF